MAKILIKSDSRFPLVIPVSQDDYGWTSGRCPACDEVISDRGQFEDTVEAIAQHVDGKCQWLRSLAQQ